MLVYVYWFFGIVALWVAYVGIETGYWLWRVRRLERMSPVPIETWQSFAASLDEPHRTQMFALIHEGRYPLGAVMQLAFWIKGRRIASFARVATGKQSFRSLHDRPGVYVLACEERYKIGCSSKVRNRVHTIQTCNPFPIVVACVFYTEDYEQLEHRLHARFAMKRVSREWFALSKNDVRTLASEAEKLNAHMPSVVSSGSGAAADN